MHLDLHLRFGFTRRMSVTVAFKYTVIIYLYVITKT